MLMLVLGAGASYDSVPIDDWSNDQKRMAPEIQPPLARDLFAAASRPTYFGRAVRAHPGITGLVASLHRIGVAEGNIEDALQTMSHKPDSVAIRQLTELRYYIRDVVRDSCSDWRSAASTVTNHTALFHRIDALRREVDESVLVVTFNYDEFIERALDEIAPGFERPGDFMDEPPYYVAKLHGSTAWDQVVELPGWNGQPSQLLERAAEIKLTGDFVGTGDGEGHPTLPAIAVPIRNKKVFECPASHVDRVVQLLPQVDRCLTIGWRGQEDHFVDLCREHMKGRPPWLVVGRDRPDAEGIAANLFERLGSADMVPSIYNGFTEFLNKPDALPRLWEGQPIRSIQQLLIEGRAKKEGSD